MSLVVDASAIADLLVDADQGSWVKAQIANHELFAPELLVAEVISVLRGWVRSGELTVERGAGALDDLVDLGIGMCPLLPLASAAWRWRDNVSSYDAMYVGLANELDLQLLSTDKRLCRAAQTLGVAAIHPE
ncbi:MAG TPA: type II toxin-antitoxin system VapC family toxin [Ilumatobacteraceae bacterium]|nr:type II toxin-antitoxin system VapC family toxin [Ilumatobacteraceae bacterium]